MSSLRKSWELYGARRESPPLDVGKVIPSLSARICCPGDPSLARQPVKRPSTPSIQTYFLYLKNRGVAIECPSWRENPCARTLDKGAWPRPACVPLDLPACVQGSVP